MNIFYLNKSWLLFGVIFSIIFVLITPYFLIVVALSLLLLAIHYFGEKTLIISSIVLFMVFTKKEFSDSARDISTAIIFVSFIIHFILKYRFDFKNYARIPKETLSFVLFLLFSTFLSTLINYSELSNFIPVVRSFVFFIYCYFLYSFLKGENEVNILIYSLFIIQAIFAFFILRDFYNEGFSFFLANGVLARFTGVVGSANVLGLITAISTNFIFVLFFSKKFAARNKRILLSYLLLNNIIIMIFTDSRAATIATLVGGAIILLTFNKKAFWISFISLASIIFILFLIPTIETFLMVLLRPSGGSTREPLWNSGVEVFLAHPIFGVGAEKFPNHFYTHFSSIAYQLFYDMGHLSATKVPSPHNFFLVMAAENGIIGLLAAVLIFVGYLFMSIKLILWRAKIGLEYFGIVICLFATGIGTLFRAFFEITGIFNYGYMSQDLPFWICVIIISFIYNKYKYLRFSKNEEINIIVHKH